MRLISCYVENFGKLSGYSHEFSDGLNVIAEENGWGKSTLMTFIKCMFYGLTGDSKRNVLESERRRYMPWQGGVFGGRLRFEADGREYEVIRKWGRKLQEDECLIIDCRTNLAADRFTAAVSGNAGSLGRQLFGIDEDSFARSAFIAQGDVPGGVTSDINAKISNLADNTNDMGNYGTAMELFRNKLNAMSESRATGQLYRQKAQINSLSGEILMEDSLISGLSELGGKITAAKAEIERITAENGLLERNLDEMTRWQDGRIKREKYRLYDKAMREAESACEEAEREMSMAGQDDCETVRMPGIMLIGIMLDIVGIVMASVGLLMHGEGMIFIMLGLIALSIGAGMTVAGAAMLAAGRKRKKEVHEVFVAAQARHDNAREAYLSAKKKLDDYVREYGTEFLNVSDCGSFTDGSGRSFASAAGINEQIRRNNAEAERLRGFVRSYAAQAEEKQELLDAIRDKKAALEELEEEFGAGRLKVRRLEIARDLLTEAKNNMTSRYIDPLTDRFAHYFSTVTGKSADSYVIDAQSNISFDDKGARHAEETLSTGLRDAVSFCLRMALVDVMYDDRKPPVILDDAFANMDDKNCRGAMQVLAEVSRTYQVIYFTCHGVV